jgi:ribonuclease R
MLIEELMLSANIKVAEYIFKKKYPTLNRIHEPMDEDKLENLNHFLKLNQILIQIKDVDYAAIQKVIENIKDDRVSKMFNYLLLRSFMQAYYGPESEGHWGLGFSHYCHFTSPIRRYPDLVVHRVLQSIIESSNPPYNHDEVFQMGFHSSQEERRAQDSERDLYKIKACRYILAKGIHKTFGNITGFRPAFVFIELEGLPIEGIVDKSELTNDFELLIRGEFSFYSKKFSKEFFLGQRVEVEIKKVDLEEMRIYLAIVGW